MIKIDKITEAITSFLKDRFEFMKGDLIEKISSIISKLISFIILFIILMLVIGFGSITLSNYLNELLNSSYLGYGIITLFYLSILISILYLSRSGKLKKIIEKELKKGSKN